MASGGIEPIRSAPYHPGTIQGARFDSFADFLCRLKDDQKAVNNTVHCVTCKKPAELFELERTVFRPIPQDSSTHEPKRLVGVAEEIRTLSRDCLVCYGGNRDSVPHVVVRSQAWVRARKGTSRR